MSSSSMATKLCALLCVVALGGCASNEGEGDDDEVPPGAVPMVLSGARDTSDPAVVAITRVDRRTGSTSLCTGTLVAPRFVMTAAHCVRGADEGASRVGVSFRASRRGGTGRAVTAANVYLPRRADRTQNDVAMIELPSPADVTPLAVNFDPDVSNNLRRIRVIGYGVTGAGRNDSGLKREGDPRVARATDHFILTAPGPGNTCFGDSGGPALGSVNGREVVVGVTSFGIGRSCDGGSGYVRTDAQRAFLSRFVDGETPRRPSRPRVATEPSTDTPGPSADKPDADDRCTIFSRGGIRVRVCV